jgi:imidazolonepropionase-like amidohydrolase
MEAGFDGIEHCSFLTDKGVVLTDQDAADLAEAGILVCPTLGYAGATAVPPSTVALLEKLGLTVADMQQASRRGVAQLHAAGVRLISGSDGGISSGKPHGILAASVASLVDSGVSAVAALTSATCLAAQACGVGDRKGRLRPGYDADLLLLDGDPMADIDALTALRAVFVAGQRATGKP